MKRLKYIAYLIVAVAVTFLGVRAWNAQRGAPLEPWHTFVPHELAAAELDRADWAQYLEVEQAIVD